MNKQELDKKIESFYDELGLPYNKEDIDYESLREHLENLSSDAYSLVNDLEEFIENE